MDNKEVVKSKRQPPNSKANGWNLWFLDPLVRYNWHASLAHSLEMQGKKIILNFFFLFDSYWAMLESS